MNHPDCFRLNPFVLSIASAFMLTQSPDALAACVTTGGTMDCEGTFARACSQSSQPDESTREMNERQERLGEFVIARGDASELLDPAEETFDQVAVLVDVAIEESLIESVGARRDDRLAALSSDGLDKGVRIVPLVRDDKFGWLILDQRFRLLDVGNLSCRENHAQGIAQGIDRHVQFCRQTSPRATDFLKAGFFWVPAECWWARTIVESMNKHSMSASPRKVVATRAQTPFSRQREKRTNVRCQCPNSGGRSRHGLPVRMIQRTASTKRRLSLAVQPGSLALPGNSSSMRSHWSSRNIFRSILPLPKSQDMTIFHSL